ncbi:MAG: hypothetical protein ACR2H9_16585 [Longimicrobiaceae bacterium]
MFAFPAEIAEGLRGATAEQLSDVPVIGNGAVLRWKTSTPSSRCQGCLPDGSAARGG